MTDRTPARTVADGMVDLGTIGASQVEATTNTVVVTVVGSADADTDLTEDHEDDLEVEQVSGCDAWHEWAVLSRPLDPTDEGACEALFVRRGDTREVIGTKDRRWQIEVEKGEVLIRNLTATAAERAHIRIKPNGEVIIDSPKVYVGASSATEKIGLGTAIKNHLDAIKSWADGHIHTAVTTATVGAGPAVGTVTVAAPTTSSPTVPDVESRHVVEN